MNKINIYVSGLVHCSVCVPKHFTVEMIEEEVNLQNPTGISSKWKIDNSPKFSTGENNPCVCERDQNRKHYLMVC
jgi:hypothetical protein